MKRALKWLGYAVLLMVVLAGAFALYVQVTGIPRYTPQPVTFTVDHTPERVERGRRTAQMLCAGCHQDPATGLLTGALMADAPPEFGTLYSANITQDKQFGIGDYSDSELAYLIRTGVTRDGRYTPPWMVKLPLLSDEELRDIIAFFRSDDPLVRAASVQARRPEPSFFSKFLTHVVMKPLPYPQAPVVAPPTTDRVAYGRYLMVAKLECHGCHSRDFATVDPLVPEKSAGYFGGGNPLRGEHGQIVHSSNLTPDPSGLGGWSEADFVRTMKLGLRPDGRALRNPMTARSELTDDEITAMWAYLRTVPRIPTAWPAPPLDPAVASSEAGRAIFHKYGCNGCHGSDGGGRVDLRNASGRFPSDEALIAHIKHPETTIPGVAMPTWDGTIEEAEYAPLARFVRMLSEARGKAPRS